MPLMTQAVVLLIFVVMYYDVLNACKCHSIAIFLIASAARLLARLHRNCQEHAPHAYVRSFTGMMLKGNGSCRSG